MTLYELANNTSIQGNIDVCLFRGEEEVNCKTFDHVDDLSLYLSELPEGWEDLDVGYIFVDGDGYLHIEIWEEEE